MNASNIFGELVCPLVVGSAKMPECSMRTEVVTCCVLTEEEGEEMGWEL